MQSNVANSSAAEFDLTGSDLGPLAWVLDELRKSLESAAKALKRFVREAEAARGSDLAALDASQLRIARQQLHQAVGALEMVGLAEPALVLRAMEAAVQKFVQQPEQCSQDAAGKIERASFALTEYLEGVLAGKPVSAVSLFPQYRDIQALIRADRIHPADLWSYEWRWLEPEFAVNVEARNYDDSARAVMDQWVLQFMKGQAPLAARHLRDTSLGFAARQTDRQPRIFWKITAAFFEAVVHDLLDSDVYLKRAASRILLQYAALAKGDTAISERLAQDLLFFCAQATSSPADTPALSAVRLAYGLTRFKPVDYELVQFGRFDPALLAQARKRIVSAKEVWSSLAGGDSSKFKAVADQFSLVTDSLLKLHPPSEPLAQALTRAIDTTVRSAQAPRIELAMEVATSVLYLEAAFADLDPNDPQLTLRTTNLAERLEGVRAGGEPQPLEVWMEELYRRVSDKQTMGSVVGELRVSLGELENSLDLFFRNPQDKTVLQAVPMQLSQMRGVLSVLGLDQASHAVLRMRESVEQLFVTEIDDQKARAAGTFERLGNNLGALSFLIDMLNYQPVLAKKLFVYDEEKGELKPLMGRAPGAPSVAEPMPTNNDLLSEEAISLVLEAGVGEVDEALGARLDALATHAALAEQSALAQTAHAAAVALSANNTEGATQALTTLASTVVQMPVLPTVSVDLVDIEEDDLRDIFLEEAREVVGHALEALALLQSDPGDAAQLTVLRRAFHTLKGSSRMVGLGEFGEAAWSLEQLLNSWLADQNAATAEFRALCAGVMAGFSNWIADIAANQDVSWSAAPFCVSADAMRTEKRYCALQLVANTIASKQSVTFPATEAVAADSFELQAPEAESSLSGHSTDPTAADLAGEPVVDFDFDMALADQLVPAAPADSAPGQAVTTALADTHGADIQSIDFESLFALPAEPDASPPIDAAEMANKPPHWPQELVSGEAIELSAADFDNHFQIPATPVATQFSQAEDVYTSLPDPMAPVEILESVEPPAAQAWAMLDSAAFGHASATSLPAEGKESEEEEEQIKVIGALRIGIPLYNVYLNEADEWSRRLVTEITEWALEHDQPVSDSTVSLAHSLAGSSATVGFLALSEIARALEHALQQSEVHHSNGAARYGKVFVDAAEDIRRLLHQFAAGFLKDPNADVLGGLLALDFSDSVLPPVNEFGDPDFLDDLLAGIDIQPTRMVLPEPAVVEAAVPTVATTILAASAEALVVPVVRLVSFVPPPVAAVVPAGTALFRTTGDEDIDAVDVIDPDLFPIFQEEGAELMPRLGGALRQWSVRPDNLSARMEVLRTLHTLKGGARLAGALRLGEMAHRMESEIEHLGSDASATQEFDPLLARFDAMQAVFESLGQTEAASASDLAVGVPATEPAAAVVVLPALEIAQSLVDTAVSHETSSGRLVTIPPPQTLALQPLRQAASASIRVPSHLLDRMVNQAGEVMITRSRLEAELGQLRGSLSDMNGNLNRLRQQLRDIELQAETQMQSRLAQAKEAQAGFDPLEFDRFTRVQELTRMMAESVNDVATVQRTLQRTVQSTEDDLIAQARQTRELQRDLLRTRMVEFEGISERLYRVVRQASKETGKQVRLDLLGGTTEMDRSMLDRMTPAFEHLLRNCVAHGIELSQDRAAAGKDPVGLITVHLRHEGNDVSVEFSDDGAGLNLQRIREKALSHGLIAADYSLSDQEAANLIFMPGFTTASQVTEIAGRGIGLDVVRVEVNALGGRIETSTVSGKGTQVKLVLPLTTAVTQVVMIRAGDLTVGVPSNVVETVRRTSAKELQQAYNAGTLEVAGEALPFFWSGALLQASQYSSEAQAKTSPVVIFRSAAQRMALHVDEVLGNREVVVKNLGPQLSRLPGLAGMSVLASGAVVLIYNPVALATVYGQQARDWSADLAEPQVLEAFGGAAGKAPGLALAAPQMPLILVVDDSITVRRVTQRLLQREGYRVAMAADGLQALERLREERPAVVLSDIEMPRMDGFDLARNIRADARLSNLPIIMITSRIAEKHREHAKELGVDHYLGKPYSEDELMRLVRHYCSAEIAVSA
ncbi:Hpt domain-containing protein [Polaromonas sp.]|uniref:hybrid sensor histidine kinase/response regulator n=1 Tax=Polaromonas sp. TaxID=1869339 RepID=UPI0017F769A8|nr:Hpt domain-containing protein [Polaromonas sp.]NMM06549.1 response regulator [Polaromonas sp.]